MSFLPTVGGGSDPCKIPLSSKAHLDGPSGQKHSNLLTKGFVTKDCLLSVLFSGPNLEVLNARTCERLAAWTFKEFSSDQMKRGIGPGGPEASKNPNLAISGKVGNDNEIVCCVELTAAFTGPSASKGTGDKALTTRLLVVALSGGHVCLFDVRSSKILRCVQMPHRVTALAHLTSPTSIPRYLAEELLLMNGLVAVGTQEGKVYLLDMVLDELEFTSDESSPSEPLFIDIHQEGGAERVAGLRTSALRRGQHPCILLNRSSSRKKVFCHVDSLSGESTCFPEAGVVVSALSYIPYLGALVIGFNYGAWQLWNVSAVSSKGRILTLEFSSPYDSEALPVTNFSFQEPENDPRNFAYIWIARGESDLDSKEEKDGISSKSTLSLHALAYQNRDDGDSGVLYSGLTACNHRFDYTLSGDTSVDGPQPRGSLLVTCGSLDQSLQRGLGEKRDLSDMDSMNVSLGVSYFVWEVIGGEDQRPSTSYYLGLFDLNAWYQAQMPGEVDTELAGQCSYFSICSMDEVLGRIEDDEESTWLVDIRIDLR